MLEGEAFSPLVAAPSALVSHGAHCLGAGSFRVSSVFLFVQRAMVACCTCAGLAFDKDAVYCYSTAYHFTMTQFTPSSGRLRLPS